jgi:hypothetical protein
LKKRKTWFVTQGSVVIIVVWAILHWFYRRMLSSRDIQIEVLQNQLANYRNVLQGASPREAAYKIAQLKGKLEAIKGAPRGHAAAAPSSVMKARRLILSVIR